ncbi:MAG: glycosyltransferase family 39 protein [Candidatus Methylomirabilia bacterium]
MKKVLPLPAGFWLALAVGLMLRIWYLSDLVAQPWFGYPLVDALTFDRTALGFLRDGFPGAFSRPPLYPLFLAVVYRMSGHSSAAVVWIQFALGLAALAPAYRLGERWFGKKAALAGAWIGACYPLRIFFEGETLDVTLFTFLFLAATWSLWQALERGEMARVFFAGLLYGAAALTRPNILIALPFIAAGAAVAFRAGWRRVPALAALGALGVVLAIAPAAVHNWRAAGALIPVAANGGVNFFLGNERGATGLTPVPPGLRWEQTMVRPFRDGQFSLSRQDRWWYARAAEEIRTAPGHWLRLLGVKTALFLNAAESSNNKALEHFTAISFPVRHYRWWFGVLLCLAVAGLATRSRGATVSFVSVIAGFGVSVVLFFVSERYRLPIVPLLAPAAAAGAREMLAATRSHRFVRASGLAALCAAAGLGVFPDWLGAGRERINADFQMGQVYLMRNEPQRAITVLERARAADASDPDVLNSLGAARLKLGDLSGADAAYRQALALGDFAEVWFNLGVVAELRGPEFRDAAAQCYRRALEVNPLDPRPRANLSALAEAALPR